MNDVTRRGFLQQTAIAVVATAWGSTRPATAEASKSKTLTSNAIRLGGPIFLKSEDPEELALAHRKLGYSAAYCPSLALNQSDRIRAVTAAFAKHGVVIAEVGRVAASCAHAPLCRTDHATLDPRPTPIAQFLNALSVVM